METPAFAGAGSTKDRWFHPFAKHLIALRQKPRARAGQALTRTSAQPASDRLRREKIQRSEGGVHRRRFSARQPSDGKLIAETHVSRRRSHAVAGVRNPASRTKAGIEMD
jgi:hypothetical protein